MELASKDYCCHIITFNARHGGESTKIPKSDWESCNISKRTEDINSIEDPLEKILAKRLKVLYVKGKRKRRVPVLFTEEIQKGLDILMSTRSQMGVDPENNFVFLDLQDVRKIQFVVGTL